MLAKNLTYPKFGKTIHVLKPKLARPKNLANHLSVCKGYGIKPSQLAAPLMGYCPGRPPKHGVLALDEDRVIFCQKTRLGEAFTQIHMSQLPAIQISKLMKQSLMTFHCPGLNFEFATRMPADDVRRFIMLFNSRLNNQ